MRLFPKPRPDAATALAAALGAGGQGGLARTGPRTKDLTARIEPGDVAVIDHEDIDRVAAEALVARRPAAVLNAARSISGRYPNTGPRVLLEAGIALVDDLGQNLLRDVPDGCRVRVEDDRVLVGGRVVATGTVQTPALVEESLEDARANLSDQLEKFAANTMQYMLRERELLINGVGVPEIRTRLAGRQALIVVRGYGYREDLAALRPYITEYRPVIIGVDGGADSVLEEGYALDIVIGDMDSVSDRALRSGAELVVHAYRDGRAPALERLEDLGLADGAVVFPASGTSEDIAMLLADEKGATLIVAVGTHATLVEFLDKGRAGMSSTFLTRLRVGSKLVDAKGVSRLYRQRVSTGQIGLLAASGLVAVAAALWSTAAGQALFQLFGAGLDDFLAWFTLLFTSTPQPS